MSELTLDEMRRMVAVLGDAEAARGWSGLSAYTNHMYGNPSLEPAAQGLQDLIGDLMHLSDALSLEPGSTLTFDDAEMRVDDFCDDTEDEDGANEARAGNAWHGLFAYVVEATDDTSGVNVSASLLSFMDDLKQLATATAIDFWKIHADAVATYKEERQSP